MMRTAVQEPRIHRSHLAKLVPAVSCAYEHRHEVDPGRHFDGNELSRAMDRTVVRAVAALDNPLHGYFGVPTQAPSDVLPQHEGDALNDPTRPSRRLAGSALDRGARSGARAA